jgi:16S rRNA G966 N2-methylase RsmD
MNGARNKKGASGKKESRAPSVCAARELAHEAREARRGSDPAHGHDVVFLDPPFRLGLLPALLERVDGCLAPGGWVYVEAPAVSTEGPGVLESLGSSGPWCTIRQARAGAVEYRMLARQADLQQDANPDTLAPHE